jgi:DNA-binding MarR family transcriptional regulator
MTIPQEDHQSHEQVLQLASELRILIGKLRRRLREESQLGDVSMSQQSVLSRLEREGPATVSSLARAEGMRPQSMAATVLALTEARLVTGAPDPLDGRQTILTLTDSCRALDRVQPRGARRLAGAHHGNPAHAGRSHRTGQGGDATQTFGAMTPVIATPKPKARRPFPHR